MNEVMTLILSYHLISFSNFVLDHQTKFVMGYSYVCVLIFTTLANIAALIHKIYTND